MEGRGGGVGCSAAAEKLALLTKAQEDRLAEKTVLILWQNHCMSKQTFRNLA